jgi:hypothetical protein
MEPEGPTFDGQSTFSRVQLEILREISIREMAYFDQTIKIAINMENVARTADSKTAVDGVTQPANLPGDWKAMRIDGVTHKTIYWNSVTDKWQIMHPSQVDGPKIDTRGNDMNDMEQFFHRFTLPVDSYMMPLADKVPEAPAPAAVTMADYANSGLSGLSVQILVRCNITPRRLEINVGKVKSEALRREWLIGAIGFAPIDLVFYGYLDPATNGYIGATRNKWNTKARAAMQSKAENTSLRGFFSTGTWEDQMEVYNQNSKKVANVHLLRALSKPPSKGKDHRSDSVTAVVPPPQVSVQPLTPV